VQFGEHEIAKFGPTDLQTCGYKTYANPRYALLENWLSVGNILIKEKKKKKKKYERVKIKKKTREESYGRLNEKKNDHKYGLTFGSNCGIETPCGLLRI
jgi:hypothetical protein